MYNSQVLKIEYYSPIILYNISSNLAFFCNIFNDTLHVNIYKSPTLPFYFLKKSSNSYST